MLNSKISKLIEDISVRKFTAEICPVVTIRKFPIVYIRIFYNFKYSFSDKLYIKYDHGTTPGVISDIVFVSGKDFYNTPLHFGEYHDSFYYIFKEKNLTEDYLVVKDIENGVILHKISLTENSPNRRCNFSSLHYMKEINRIYACSNVDRKKADSKLTSTLLVHVFQVKPFKLKVSVNFCIPVSLHCFRILIFFKRKVFHFRDSKKCFQNHHSTMS